MSSASFMHDFSLILIMAGLMAISSRLLRIPLLLGYICGGFLLGSHPFGLQFIHDQGLIHQLSELGVVFLMFYIGLEFDLKKLRRLFGPAICALLLQTIFMLFLGRIVAPILGWGGLNGLFLGGLLAISSTMITLPILQEQRALDRNFAQLSIGILILEDILAIMLLVVLSGIAITGHFAWDAIGRVTFLVGVFVVSVFFIGRLLAPFLIRLLLRFNSEEVLTIAIVGFLMAIGLLAERSHFSIALGAFLAGAILSQSQLSEAIEKHMLPIRTLFTAIFFISVGLMINLPLLVHFLGPIIALTILTFLLKVLACFAGLYLSGQRGEDGLRAALSKAQIGEFSFVIASLGTSLGVASEGLLNIAVGVSIGTIICTSLLSPRGEKIYGKILRHIPHGILELGKLYQNLLTIIRGRLSQNLLLKVGKKPLAYIVCSVLLFSALLFTVSMATSWLLTLNLFGPWTRYVPLATWSMAAILSLPLLVPTVRQINVLLFALADNALARSSVESKRLLRPNLSGIFQSAIFVFLLLIFGGTFLSVASPTLPKGTALYAFFLLLTIAAILLWKQILRINSRLETYFIDTFNQDIESQIEHQRQRMLEKFRAKYPLDLELTEIRIVEGHCGCGKKISDLPLRSQFDGHVVAIRRGQYTAFSPDPESTLFPNDRLLMMARRSRLPELEHFFATADGQPKGPTDPSDDFEIEQVCLGPKCEFVGKSLIEINLRKQYGVSVVGIFRNREALTLPGGNERLMANDILILVGSRRRIDDFQKRLMPKGETNG